MKLQSLIVIITTFDINYEKFYDRKFSTICLQIDSNKLLSSQIETVPDI